MLSNFEKCMCLYHKSNLISFPGWWEYAFPWLLSIFIQLFIRTHCAKVEESLERLFDGCNTFRSPQGWNIKGVLCIPLIFQYCIWQHFDSEEGARVQGQRDWLVLFIITNYCVTNEFEIRLKILWEKSIVLIRAFQVIYHPTFCYFVRKEQDKTCVTVGCLCIVTFHLKHILISWIILIV